MNSHPRPHLALLLAIGILGLITGCFSGLAADQYRNSPIPSASPVLSDSILAMGQPDEALLQKLQCPQALIFIGEHKSYLLLEGGQTLLAVSKELDANKIILNMNSHALYYKDGKIWGSFQLIYKDDDPTDGEKRSLARLGFLPPMTAGSTNLLFYSTTVTVAGLAQAPIPVPATQKHDLHRAREIVFYPPPKSAVVPNLKVTALMPFAIAADIATSPLQALFVVLTIKDGRP